MITDKYSSTPGLDKVPTVRCNSHNSYIYVPKLVLLGFVGPLDTQLESQEVDGCGCRKTALTYVSLFCKSISSEHMGCPNNF